MSTRTEGIAGRSGLIYGVRFDFLSFDDVLIAVEEWVRRKERKYITFTTPHVVMLSRRDEQTKIAIAKAELTLPDGVGITYAARLYGLGRQARVPGPALMLYLCDKGRRSGLRHYFYGGVPGVAEVLSEKLATLYPGLIVVGHMSPPFGDLTVGEKRQICSEINSASADVIWVGLGAPKQEKWMAENVGRISAAAMLGVGAAFDFHSGRICRAPSWISALGFEWIYRTCKEPRRLGRKCLDGFIFLLGVLEERLRVLCAGNFQ